MDLSFRKLVAVCCLLTLAVSGCNAACTYAEQRLMSGCLAPYDPLMLIVLGTSGSCSYSKIRTYGLCSAFTSIVNCMNCLPLSNTQCRPVGIATVNAGILIPCKVQDFVAVCKNAPAIYEGKPGTTNPTTCN